MPFLIMIGGAWVGFGAGVALNLMLPARRKSLGYPLGVALGGFVAGLVYVVLR